MSLFKPRVLYNALINMLSGGLKGWQLKNLQRFLLISPGTSKFSGDLDDLNNVDTDGKSDGDHIYWNAGTGKWEDVAAAAGVLTINGISPDGAGEYGITAGANITITPGVNGFEIAAAGGGSTSWALASSAPDLQTLITAGYHHILLDQGLTDWNGVLPANGELTIVGVGGIGPDSGAPTQAVLPRLNVTLGVQVTTVSRVNFSHLMFEGAGGAMFNFAATGEPTELCATLENIYLVPTVSTIVACEDPEASGGNAYINAKYVHFDSGMVWKFTAGPPVNIYATLFAGCELPTDNSGLDALYADASVDFNPLVNPPASITWLDQGERLASYDYSAAGNAPVGTVLTADGSGNASWEPGGGGGGILTISGVGPDGEGALALVEGANITITPNAEENQITLAAAGGGGGDPIWSSQKAAREFVRSNAGALPDFPCTLENVPGPTGPLGVFGVSDTNVPLEHPWVEFQLRDVYGCLDGNAYVGFDVFVTILNEGEDPILAGTELAGEVAFDYGFIACGAQFTEVTMSGTSVALNAVLDADLPAGEGIVIALCPSVMVEGAAADSKLFVEMLGVDATMEGEVSVVSFLTNIQAWQVPVI